MPPDSSTPAAASPWNPRRILNFLVLAILVSSSFLNNWEYRRGWLSDPSSYMDIAAGTGRAPDQYRIGVIDPAEYVAVHGHVALRNVLSIIDSLAEAVALLLLLSLFRRSKTYANANPIAQLAGELAFLFLAEFYLSWLFWYHRPETLAAAALVACWLGLLSRWQSHRGAPIFYAFGLISVTTAQSFIRADIAFTLNLGLLCIAIFAPTKFPPRATLAAVSLAGVATSAGIELWLMRIVFSHARYGSTPVIQLIRNLTEIRGYLPFLLFTAPFFWTLHHACKEERSTLTPATQAMLLSATLFLAIWSVVGVLGEVRIFLPYTLALAPLTATFFMQKIAVWSGQVVQEEGAN